MKPEEIIARAINPDAWWNHDNGFVTRDEAGKLAIVEPSMRRATAALRALEEAGYRVVPVEATREMLIAGQNEPLAELMSGEELFCADPCPVWRAMLDAAGGAN